MAKREMTRSSESESPSTISIDEALPARPRSAKKREKKDRRKYRRVNVDLPLELHFRLSAHATMRRKDMMTLACEMIEQKCANLTKDPELKAAFADMSRQTSESA
jgi:hypothetical protein